MYATLPLAIRHDSETLWPSSAESASIRIMQRAGSPSLWPGSHHKRQEDSHFDYSSACLQWAVQTYTANLQRYTVAGCLNLLSAAWSSVPTATLWGTTIRHNTIRVLWNTLQLQHWSNHAFKMQMLEPVAQCNLHSGHILCSETLSAERR